jgi:hypothetical protein
VTTEEEWMKEMANNLSQASVKTSSTLPLQGGIFNKFKGLFRSTAKVVQQESHA